MNAGADIGADAYGNEAGAIGAGGGGGGGGGGSGDVAGPASATDNAAARFNGTSGKSLQNSSVIIEDAGNIILAGGSKLIEGTSGDLIDFSVATLISFYCNSVEAFRVAEFSCRFGVNVEPISTLGADLGSSARNWGRLYHARALVTPPGVISTNTTINATSGNHVYFVTAAVTVTFPSVPHDGMTFLLRGLGSSFTVAPGGSATLEGATTVADGECVRYLYRLADTTWYRMGTNL